MEFSLDASTTTKTVPIPARSALVKVATTGTWTGTLTLSREINGESANYEEGAFTANTDFRFSPATDYTTFTYSGTGEVNIAINIASLG